MIHLVPPTLSWKTAQSRSVEMGKSVGNMAGCGAHLYCRVSNHLRGDLLDFPLRQKILLPLGLLACSVIAAYLLVLDGRFITEEADGNLVRAVGQGLNELNMKLPGLTRAST